MVENKNLSLIQPAFENCNNCIIMSTDNGFAPATAVAIQSLIDTASKNNYYDIIILHSRVSPLMQEAICKMEKPENVSVRFYNVAKIVDSMNLYTENRKSITMETYYRLFAPWLLDHRYERALYIDGDMIATRDVYEVFGYDIGDNLIAGVKDYWGICNCFMPNDPRREYQESIGIKDIEKYIIAATVLFNLPKFRKEFTLKQVMETCTMKEWKQHDQDVVNVLCQGSVYHLTADWGYVSDYGNNHYLPQYLQDELAKVTDPVLIHFAGSRKPWLKAYAEDYFKFWKYAEKTPFFKYLVEKIVSKEYRAYLLNELAEGKAEYRFTDDQIIASYKGIDFYELEEYGGPLVYHSIKIKNGLLHVEGSVQFYATSPDTPIEVFLKINDEVIPASVQYTDNTYRKALDITTCRGELFEFDYELDPSISEYTITAVCKINGYTVEKKHLSFSQFAPICRRYENCYYYSNGWVVKKDVDNTVLNIYPASKKDVKGYEKAFLLELRQIGKQAERHALILRPLIHLLKKFVKKPIWMVSDRVMKADDNGEVFFKFLAQKKKRQVTPCFVISRKSPDYKRLKKIGKVVTPYSIMHRIYHLLAEYTISSQTDMVFRNPMRKSRRVYLDMLSDVGFIFLQHGVIHNDISGWLCKKRQACVGFVTTTQKEHDSIVNGDYHYSEEQVWLTGMPRFDNLSDQKEKIVTILPTWRRFLTQRQNAQTGIWELINDFSNTKYATFYRNLMNDKRLNEAAKKNGYKIQFKIHPSFLTHEDQFGFNDYVNIVDNNTPYREIYSKSSLIVTDYSSAIYDFIYLRKPMVYCQFDREDFFENHMTDNVELQYETEGYGEVVYDLESTVNIIIDYIENDCKLKSKYRERIDKFFAFNDRNNCERIYEKIIDLKSK